MYNVLILAFTLFARDCFKTWCKHKHDTTSKTFWDARGETLISGVQYDSLFCVLLLFFFWASRYCDLYSMFKTSTISYYKCLPNVFLIRTKDEINAVIQVCYIPAQTIFNPYKRSIHSFPDTWAILKFFPNPQSSRVGKKMNMWRQTIEWCFVNVLWPRINLWTITNV